MAGGQQINVGQGNVVYAEITEDALAGSAATSAAGTNAPGASIRLRSRKVGGGTSSFLLTGQFTSSQQETPVKQLSALLATPSTTGSQGAFTKGNARSLTGVLVQISQTSIGDQTGSWDIGAVTFTEGTAGSIQLPVPSGYATGGFYQVVTGTLPTGITLSDSGLLTYDGVGTSASASITISYTEPGAISTLTLHSTSAGTFPYMATVYPTEGAVPENFILLSPDDSTLRSNVLSTWPDNSAQVMVVAGHKAVSASSTTDIRLRPGAPSGTALTTAYIDSILTSVAVNFGTALSFTNFTSGYDRIWWANSQVICARYRLPITNKNVMEAVIDVHAFANGRVFVEVVIENGQINASAASPTAPSTEIYTNATVAVNGTTIATVSSPTSGMTIPRSRMGGTYTFTGHAPFRAWYCSGWVGGDPGIDVTHDITSMMAHPLFHERAEASTETFSTKYAQTYDTYEPWATCRLRSPGMNGGSTDEQIGALTDVQTDYIQNGSKFASRATLSTALAMLTMNINWRHTDGTVPTMAQMSGKYTSGGTWPANAVEPGYGVNGTGDGSHIPSSTVVPFLCRPSPCFIDIAQKEFCWNITNYGRSDNLNGQHIYDQLRSRAWRLRNYGQTIFLTPDSETTRKADYRTALYNNVTLHNAMLDKSYNTLGVLIDPEHDGPVDHSGTKNRFQMALWWQHFCIMTWHAIDKAKILRDSQATEWATMVDRVAAQPVRYINEATGGEWRLIGIYSATIGDYVSASNISMAADWGTTVRNAYSGTPPATVSGTWTQDGTETATPSWASNVVAVSGAMGPPTNYDYDGWFWGALCCAVERDISGAATAWAKVQANITNLSTWQTGFRDKPRYNRYPRNV